MKRIGSIILIICLLFAAGCSGNPTDSGQAADTENQPTESADKIVISGKKFSEQFILAQIIGQLLQAKTNLDVEIREGIGGTPVLIQGLKDGDVDIYVEYTGTGLLYVLKDQLLPDDTPESVYDRVKKGFEEKHQLTWLKPLGFSNTYSLAMKEEVANKLGIKTISELAKYSKDLVIGADNQFFERPDGFEGLVKTYGLQFKKKVDLEQGLIYSAIDNKEIDVLVGYSTDGRIPRVQLKLLEDDKRYFPPYYAAPVTTLKLLEKHPEIADVLNQLAGKLDEKTMADLNALADVDKKDPDKIAKEWLEKSKLLP